MPHANDKRRMFVNHLGEWGQRQKGVFGVIDHRAKRTAPPIGKQIKRS
jgi:hypothetical protein